MSIVIPPELESRLRAQAQAEGLTVEAYLESLVAGNERAEEELIALALEGLHSGDAVRPDPGYVAATPPLLRRGAALPPSTMHWLDGTHSCEVFSMRSSSRRCFSSQ